MSFAVQQKTKMEDLEIKYYFYMSYGISGVRIEIHEGALKITD